MIQNRNRLTNRKQTYGYQKGKAGQRYIRNLGLTDTYHYVWASLVTQMVENLPEMQKTQVQSLGPEDPLVEEMATHSSILAWNISWTEEPGGQQSMGSQRVRYDWAINTTTTTIYKTDKQ